MKTVSVANGRSFDSEGSEDSVEDYYRINVFFPTVDEVLQDMRLRFGVTQQQATNFSRAVPAFMHFDEADGDWIKLEKAVSTYSDMFLDPAIVIKSEYKLWRLK